MAAGEGLVPANKQDPHLVDQHQNMAIVLPAAKGISDEGGCVCHLRHAQMVDHSRIKISERGEGCPRQTVLYLDHFLKQVVCRQNPSKIFKTV